MTIYYTAKDIEEMAATGHTAVRGRPWRHPHRLRPGNCRQLNIALVKSGQATSTPPAAAVVPNRSEGRAANTTSHQAVCMAQAHPLQRQLPASQPAGGESSTTVNRLIDLMGNAMKRGG